MPLEKDLSPFLMKRMFQSFLDELDPTKTTFVVADISKWLEPSDPLLDQSIASFKKGEFAQFFEMQDAPRKSHTATQIY